MMNKLTMILMLAVLISPAVAENLGTVSTADYLRVWCKAIDASGLEQSPDSGHVLVSFNREATANSASYSAAWITSGATGIEIDSVLYNGHTYYYFVDLVADIDNGEGNGPYFGDVVLYTGGLPWHNKFAFTLATDEFTDYLAMVAAILDTLNLYDNWIAQQAEVANLNAWNPTIDSTHVSGLNATRLARLDSLNRAISKIFQTDTTGQKPAGSFGRLLTYLDSLNNLLTIADIASEVADSTATRDLHLGAGGLDLDTSFTNLVSQVMQVYYWVTDSTYMMSGYPGRTILPWAIPVNHADLDTTFYGIGATISKAAASCGVIYYHSGGVAGGPPTDSIRTFRL